MKRCHNLLSAFGALFVLVSLFTVLAFTLANGNAQTDASLASRPLYLALGDSISWGYSPNGRLPENQRFVNILAEEKGYRVQNESKVGNTSEGILEQLKSGALDSSVKEAQVVTITCGGNDLMHLVYGKTAERYNRIYPTHPITVDDVVEIMENSGDSRQETILLMALDTVATEGIIKQTEIDAAIEDFIQNLNRITAKIKSMNPDAKVFIATQYDPYENISGLFSRATDRVGTCVDQLREKVRENAEAGGYTAVDVYAAFQGNADDYCNATDSGMQLDFHPSAIGHEAIADAFAAVVTNGH